MALHTPHALLSELGPTLKTHLREHFGGNTTLHPHKASAAATHNMPVQLYWASTGWCMTEDPP